MKMPGFSETTSPTFPNRSGLQPRRRRTRALCLALAAALALFGCSDGATSTPSDDDPPPGTGLEVSPCDTGEMPTLDGACKSVGPGEPGAGFSVHADGWGHVAVKPKVACEGTSMARLGTRECVPIDDAARSFPPSNVHAVVGTTEELTSALATAPAGGTIALLPGTYAPFEIAKAVRLVGHSPDHVVIEGPGTMEASSCGITVSTSQKVTLESMTLRGFGMAVKDVGQGRLEVANLYITDSRAGLVAAHQGTRLSARDTVVEGPDPARDVWDSIGVATFFGAAMELDNVDIRRFNWAVSARYPASDIAVRNAVVQFEQRFPYPAGVEAWGGANVTMTDSVMSTREGRLVAVGTNTEDMSSDEPLTPGSVHIRRSVLEQRGSIMNTSSAIDVYQGATLELDEVSLRHEAFCGIGVSESEAGSHVEIRNSLFSNADSRGAVHSFLIASEGTIKASGTAFVGAKQVGFIADGSSSEIDLEDSFVTETRNLDGSTNGAVTAFNYGRVNLIRTTLSNNEGIGIVGIEGASIAMSDVLLRDTRDLIGYDLGIGVGVKDARLSTRNCRLIANQGAGLFVDTGSKGLLLDSVASRSPVGLLLADGVELKTSDVEPAEVPEGTVVLYRTDLENNAVPVESADGRQLVE